MINLKNILTPVFCLLTSITIFAFTKPHSEAGRYHYHHFNMALVRMNNIDSPRYLPSKENAHIVDVEEVAVLLGIFTCLPAVRNTNSCSFEMDSIIVAGKYYVNTSVGYILLSQETINLLTQDEFGVYYDECGEYYEEIIFIKQNQHEK